jgi:hypothetical protein
MDIIAKLEVVSGLRPPESPIIEVGKNVAAGGNVSFAGINVSGNTFAAELAHRTKRTLDALRSRLGKRRLVIVLHGCHEVPEPTAAWLWLDLWQEHGMRDLIADGLVLACFCESADGICRHSASGPTPDLFVQLPARYEGQARRQAQADIARLIANRRGEVLEMAEVRAETLLESWRLEPSKVYESLPAYLHWGGTD